MRPCLEIKRSVEVIFGTRTSNGEFSVERPEFITFQEIEWPVDGCPIANAVTFEHHTRARPFSASRDICQQMGFSRCRGQRFVPLDVQMPKGFRGHRRKTTH